MSVFPRQGMISPDMLLVSRHYVMDDGILWMRELRPRERLPTRCVEGHAVPTRQKSRIFPTMNLVSPGLTECSRSSPSILPYSVRPLFLLFMQAPDSWFQKSRRESDYPG